MNLRHVLVAGVLFVLPLWAHAAVPAWQKIYKAYNINGTSDHPCADDACEFPVPAGWGWPMPFRSSTGWDNPRVHQFIYKPIPSYFDAVVTNDQTNYIVAKDLIFKDGLPQNNKHELAYYQDKKSLMVSAGTSIDLQWACQTLQFFEGGTGNDIYAYTSYYYAGLPKGYGFDVPIKKISDYYSVSPRIWSVTVKPTNTTTYSLVCQHDIPYYEKYFWMVYWMGYDYLNNNNYPKNDAGVVFPSMPKMSLTIKVCSSSAQEFTPGVYKLPPSSGTKTLGIDVVVNGKGYAFCIWNPTANTYLIPAGSAAEMDAFVARVTNATLKDDQGNVVSFQ